MPEAAGRAARDGALAAAESAGSRQAGRRLHKIMKGKMGCQSRLLQTKGESGDQRTLLAVILLDAGECKGGRLPALGTLGEHPEGGRPGDRLGLKVLLLRRLVGEARVLRQLGRRLWARGEQVLGARVGDRGHGGGEVVA